MTRSSIDTLCAKADHFLDVATGAVVPPIQPSTTFARDDRYELINPAHGYVRDSSPSVIPAERVITELEQGSDCLLFASGMAAITAVFRSTSPTASLVVPDSLYHGTRTWLERFEQETARSLTWYRTGDSASLAQAIDKAVPQLLWVETPSNPMIHVTDLSLAASQAHAVGALLVVDSTAATPVHTQPLGIGADIVVHSATKSLNGHSDVAAGAVVFGDAKTEAADQLSDRIRAERAEAGAILSAFDAWLLLRGLRTLPLRVRQASATALTLAHFLESHDDVEAVLYPGLASSPDHACATRQMKDGFGSLMSFLVAGDARRTRAVATSLEIIVSATSLGGTETLIEHRASVEPPGSPVPPNLLRLSVGLEAASDLISDLDHALSRSRESTS